MSIFVRTRTACNARRVHLRIDSGWADNKDDPPSVAFQFPVPVLPIFSSIALKQSVYHISIISIGYYSCAFD